MIRISLFVLLGLSACSKKEGSKPPPAPAAAVPMGQVTRAEAACADYKKRVCAAAEKTPSLAADCRGADARLQALELQKTTLLASDTKPEFKQVALGELKRTSEACTKDALKLRDAGK